MRNVSLLHRPSGGPACPGWWCEVRAPEVSFAYRADRPERALVWMRIEVRLLLREFGADDRQRAYHWLDQGQWEALYRLRAGEPYAFTAAGVVWTARPVLFLPGPV
ncbi:hypothetical protein [Streptomyces sp. NPDC059398]|uniref:hypothetical protein n=1 Tax=Streptomyces sp. NPDC059398 TaxID=3346820 RepID=UPI003693D973